MRGTVRLHPRPSPTTAFDAGRAGRHRWWPIAPLARVEVELERPALRWCGTGYLDTNAGDEPLEARLHHMGLVPRQPAPRALPSSTTSRRRDGSERALALRCRPDGSGRASRRRCRRQPARTAVARAPPHAGRGRPAASVRQTLEDTPFYARSVRGHASWADGHGHA